MPRLPTRGGRQHRPELFHGRRVELRRVPGRVDLTCVQVVELGEAGFERSLHGGVRSGIEVKLIQFSVDRLLLGPEPVPVRIDGRRAVGPATPRPGPIVAATESRTAETKPQRLHPVHLGHREPGGAVFAAGLIGADKLLARLHVDLPMPRVSMRSISRPALRSRPAACAAASRSTRTG
jgi:hypothetical protein